MYREACRALITDESGRKLLLAKRADDDYAGGSWCALGGKIDRGESPEAAVARETYEESGLILSGVRLFREHINETGTWHTYFFEATATGDIVVDTTEHSELAFFDEEQLEDLDVAFNHLTIFKEYLKSRQFTG